jgi:hypothetical protein
MLQRYRDQQRHSRYPRSDMQLLLRVCIGVIINDFFRMTICSSKLEL